MSWNVFCLWCECHLELQVWKSRLSASENLLWDNSVFVHAHSQVKGVFFPFYLSKLKVDVAVSSHRQ